MSRLSEKRASLCVVLIGPDGSGKSTVARGLLDRDDLGFAERDLVRWSFNLLPPLDRVVEQVERFFPSPIPDPAHNGMRDLLPVWQSALITAYHAVDMGLARVTILRRARRESRLFLFDRSFFDYYFLMGHQRLAPWYLRLLSRLVPAPDLLLYVRRSADAIYRDKPELTRDEIARQQTVIERLVASLPCGVTLDGDAGVDQTVAEAADHIRTISGAERRAIPADAAPASTTIAFVKQTPVHERFEQRATETPDAPALAHPGGVWSYRALRRSAWRIAAALEQAGVGAGDRVAVHGRRSPGVIAAMLGVWRSGGTLLLIDPTLPAERRARLVAAAGVSHHVHVADARDRLSEANAARLDRPTIHVDAQTGAIVDAAATIADAPTRAFIAEAHAPAYVFFTSGTTGTPKGVLGTHDGLAHFIAWQQTQFGIGAGDRVAHLTSLMFDVVLRDVLLPLTSGATLVLPSPEDERPDRVMTWLNREGITAVHAVPSLSRAWLRHRHDTIASLRYTFFAGEPLTSSLVTAWRDACPSTRIVNLYGPTETTLAKCAGVVPDPAPAGVQSVGLPLPETEVLVLSDRGTRCAIGETGELLIRTPYRSLGYIAASPDESARFQPNPFQSRTDMADVADIVYRTGDLGRLDAEGVVHVLGRCDDQVKIRGARVEPAEVEAAIRTTVQIEDVAVVGRTMADGEMALAAYVVPARETPDATAIRRALEAVLPSWLVPSWFVPVDRLPLTANGKLDRRSLPDPREQASTEPTAAPETQIPETPIERLVADAWTDALGANGYSRHTDFFTHGGNSLKALLLASRLAERTGVPISIATIYARPTIADQAAYVGEVQRYEARHIDRGYMVFGEERPQRVFAFPPLLGYGLAWHRLAHFVTDHAFVAFDFPDSGDPLAAYVEAIEEFGSGPLVLVGYSAGGNLAFEVTQRLEAIGRRVDAIVMLDARRLAEPEALPDDEIDAIVRANLANLSSLMEQDEQFQQYVRNDYALGRMAAKMRAFLQYERGRVNDGVVDADIHFIHSAERSVCQTWATATRGRFVTYDGHGRHVEMGHGATAEANGRLIGDLLARLQVDRAPALRTATASGRSAM